MENKPIVEVQQVSMKFNLASEKFDSFKEYFIKTLKKQISYKMCIRDRYCGQRPQN